MGIRRTRQQKMEAQVRRQEGHVQWSPQEQASLVEKKTPVVAPVDSTLQKYFFLDLQKTLLSTVVVVGLLIAVAFVLR